jgi:hypothetical protein
MKPQDLQLLRKKWVHPKGSSLRRHAYETHNMANQENHAKVISIIIVK